MSIKRYNMIMLLFLLIILGSSTSYAFPQTIIYEGEVYPPLKYETGGDLHGFEMELNNYIFNGEEYILEYSTNDWDSVYSKLKNNEIDTCGMLAILDERNDEIFYSDTVLKSFISIYSKRGVSDVSLANLSKYRVGVGRSQYTEAILLNDVRVTDYVVYDDISSAVDALNDGSIEVLFENQEVVKYYLVNKGLQGVIIPQRTNLFPVKVAYGVKKNRPELVKYINKKIKQLKKSGIYEEVYRKHFYEPSYYHKEVHEKRCALILFSAVIIFILLQLYVRYLKKKVSKTYGELRKQHEWLSITLANIGDAVITTDEKGIITLANLEAEKLFDMSAKELLERRLDELMAKIRDTNGEANEILIDGVIKRGLIISLENNTIFNDDNDPERLISGTIAPIRNDSLRIVGSVTVLKDITEIKRTEQIIHNMEYYDSLTGLPNRTLFSDRLNMALAQARRNKQQSALIILDLDNFKAINDTLGHSIGDLLLKQVGETISTSLREVDTVARLGGDEFIILQPQINDVGDATKISERIIEKFQTPWTLEDKEYYITASLGIAIFPNDGEDSQTLFKNADTAMYRAKEVGKNNFQLFTESLNIKVQQKLEIENSLRRAIEREEFVLFYQPQVDIISGKVVGVEALLRWYRPGFGLVPPMDFIPLAEETGLIIPIGEWVLRKACRQNKKWIDEGIEPILMAVNLSARQFQQQNLFRMIESVLEETGLDPKLLELEITESTAMKNLNLTIQILTRLREKGIRISLDDFGTGYSSLNYLKCLPIDTLKIDKSFVHDITANSNEEAIARSVIVLAHKMLLTVVAEGVETNEQLEFLKEEKCDKFQGYLFCKPLPTDEIEALLKKETFRRNL